MTSEKFAVIFPENTGYLFCQALGKGVQSSTMIVRSIDDKKDYVRKKTRPTNPNNKANRGIDKPDVSLHKQHQRIPEIHWWEQFAVLPESHRDHHHFQSLSLVSQYCNGGTVGRFLNVLRKAKVMPSEVLLWHMMDQLMEVVDVLHHDPSPVAHKDLHPYNIFLNFLREDSPLPDFYVGDFGSAVPLRRQTAWNDNGPSVVEDPFEDEDIYKDWDHIGHVMQSLVYCGYTGGAYGVITEAGMTAHLSRFSLEFQQCWTTFEEIIWTAAKRHQHIAQFRDLHTVVEKHAQLSRNSMDPTTCYQWTRQDRYAHPDLPKEEQYQAKHDVVLFDSRYELLQRTETIPGPWHIARVNPDTMDVVGIEKLAFNLHLPPIKPQSSDLYWGTLKGVGRSARNYEDHDKADQLVKTEVDHIGLDKILVVAAALERPGCGELKAFFDLDVALTNKILHPWWVRPSQWGNPGSMDGSEGAADSLPTEDMDIDAPSEP